MTVISKSQGRAGAPSPAAGRQPHGRAGTLPRQSSTSDGGSVPAAPARGTLAFSLLELLVVISIIGILAAVALPALKNFRPDLAGTAGRQLLNDVSHARQLAISQRTTVYMVFVPTNFWADPNYANLSVQEKSKATNLFDKQLIGYNFVTLHSLGDQPGNSTPRYLSSWKALPAGAFIPLLKFNDPSAPSPAIVFQTNNAGTLVNAFNSYAFRTTNNIPFPSEFAVNLGNGFVTLPYIAFNYLGQLVNGNNTLATNNEVIPLVRGNLLFARDPVSKVALPQAPLVAETPTPGVASMEASAITLSNAPYNLVNIDWLTGRARLEQPPIP